MQATHSQAATELQAVVASKEEHLKKMNTLHAQEVAALKESQEAAVAATMTTADNGTKTMFEELKKVHAAELAQIAEKHSIEVDSMSSDMGKEKAAAAASVKSSEESLGKGKMDLAASEAAHANQVSELQAAVSDAEESLNW